MEIYRGGRQGEETDGRDGKMERNRWRSRETDRSENRDRGGERRETR